MGTNLPGYNPDALLWLEARIASWAADPVGIGLTSGQVATLATDITDARTAFTSVQAARGASMDATVAFNTSADAMRADAGPLIANIKNFADNSADPSVIYTAASVLPRDPPSPADPPEQPLALQATLNGDGSVTIGFDARGPVGTVWAVKRKLAGETAYSHIGHADAATKSFLDATVTPGVTTASYLVQGVRGSVTGPVSPALIVYFGTADAEAMGIAA